MNPRGSPDRLVLFGRILTDGLELPPSRVEIEAGHIVSIEPSSACPDADVDAGDGWLAPGLVDLQVNGAAGVDLTSASDPAAAIATVAGALPRHGTTAFCPTVVSSTLETILSRIGIFRARPLESGAESLGAHVEGPFINPVRRGVHDPGVLREPTIAELDRWLAVDVPAIVTLAPELPGAREAIEWLVARGVVVSLGHSDANAAEAAAGMGAGATMGTHLFNAMPPLLHRAPGLVGALLSGSATIGLIADGTHVDPIVVDLVVRAIGVGRIALVSDAMAAAAAPPGSFPLGDQIAQSDGRVVRRADGTLAGSAALLDVGIRNARAWLPSLSPAQVIQMATETPARLLGGAIAARKGRIAPGYDADVVVLDDAFGIRETIVRGTRIAAGVSR